MRPQTEAAYHTRGCSSSLDLIVATRRAFPNLKHHTVARFSRFLDGILVVLEFDCLGWTQDRARVVQAEDSIFHKPLPSYRRERDHSQPPMPDHRAVIGDTHIYGGRSSQTLVSRCTESENIKKASNYSAGCSAAENISASLNHSAAISP
jgi:hypothetical protein